jgi:hypothetical protein
MLFRNITAVYSENNTKPINTFYGKNAGLLNKKACGTYKYHLALKG